MRNLFHSILLTGFITAGVFAQPEMDPTFSGSGKTLINYGATAVPQDVAIQPDNKIILIAPCWHLDLLTVPFCAVRLYENGSVDNSFRSGNPFSSFGGVYTKFSGPSGVNGAALGVALQSDGKVILAGYATSSDDNIALVRYNGADGTLDTSFGTGGTVFTDIAPGSNDRAAKVAIQPDGKIVIVGTSGNDQILARYLPDGTLDTSFGTGGIARTAVSGSTFKGSVLKLMYDGRIVAGGYVQGSSYLITRYNSDGSPDTTWDGDGILSIPSTLANGILAIHVQLDGRVVALASEKSIYRFNTDGSPDTTFDGDGVRTTVLPGSTIQVYNMAVSAGGRITVVGSYAFVLHSGGPWWQYITARYMPDGSLDTSYSDDGYLNFDIGTSHNDGATVVTFDTVGRTFIGGFSASGSAAVPFEHPIFSAARLSAPPAALVDVSGRVTGPSGNGVSGVTVSTSGVSAVTNPFGYYTLHNVETNRTYVFSVRSKTDLAFNKRTILVDGQLAGLDFIGSQLSARTSK